MKGSVMKIVPIAALAALLATPLLAPGQAKSNDKAVQEIIDFRNRYLEAEENKDVAYLDKIFADDFFALNPQGQLLDKPHMLENMKRTDRVFKVLNPRETQVHFYGDVAILTEHVTVDGEDKGRHFGGEFRFVRIFAKQNGNWKVVMAQGAPLPQAAADSH
jgi:ketosteroid isomerase-like protein